MNENLPAKPNRLSEAAHHRSKPLAVTGRLKTAIDLMVHDGLSDSEAAVKAKMTVTGVRLALRQAHVRRYLREQRQVLHTRELAKNSHALIDVRDNAANQMARVAAIRALENIAAEEDQVMRGEHRGAGVSIMIVAGPQAPAVVGNDASTHKAGIIIDAETPAKRGYSDEG